MHMSIKNNKVNCKSFLLIFSLLTIFSLDVKCQGYCAPTYFFNTPCTDVQISGFGLYTYSGPSNGCDTTHGYDTTGLSIGPICSIHPGKAYSFAIVGSKKSACPAGGIWIDFNHNDTFEDATELLDSTNNAGSQWKGSITIPSTISTGIYRLRIRLVANKPPYIGRTLSYLYKNGACKYRDEGEAEDYLIKIVAGPAIDLSVINLWPNSSCSLDSNEVVTIRIKNLGYDTLKKYDTVLLSFKLNSLLPVTDTIILSKNISPGDSLIYKFKSGVNLLKKGDYFFKAWVKSKLDSNSANDTLFAMRTNKTVIKTLYYTQTFENINTLPKDWTNDPNDAGFDWIFATANIDYAINDHTLPNSSSGHYMLIKNSNGSLLPDNKYDSINLITPCFDISNLSNPFIEFWMINYRLNNNSIHKDEYSQLYLDIYENGKWHYNIDTPLFNVGPNWSKVLVNLKGYSGIVSLKFRANTNTMSTKETSILLDDFKLFDWKNTDVGVTSIINPLSNSYGDSNQHTSIIIKNFGSISQKNIPFQVYISAKNQGLITILKDTLYKILAPGQSDTVLVNPTFNCFKGDEYFLQGYTTLAGDSIQSNDTSFLISNIHTGIEQPQISSSKLCAPGKIKFFVTNNPGYNTYWYDQANSVLPIYIGDTMVTAELTRSKIYFAAYTDVTSYSHLGPSNDSITHPPKIDTSYNTSNKGWGEAINAPDTFYLDSLTIYPEHSGEIILHYAGNVNMLPDEIKPIKINVIQKGKPYSKVRIGVGWKIPKGNGFQIFPTGTIGGLTYNNDSAAWPYTSGAVSIYFNAPSYSGPTKTYYWYWYLYDWTVRGYGGYSKHTSAWAVIDSPGLTSFSPSLSCFNTQVHFNDSSKYSSIYRPKYYWNFGDGFTDSSIIPTHKYLKPGKYITTLRLIFFSGCSDSSTRIINVNKGIDTDWTLRVDTLKKLYYLGKDTNSLYKWYFGDGDSSLSDSGTHSYILKNKYNLEMIVSGKNKCIFKKDSVINFLPSGIIKTINKCSLISILPNPFSNQFRISYQLENSGYVDISLLDNKGIRIYNLPPHYQTSGLHEELFALPPNLQIKQGMYYLQIMTNKIFEVKKVIKID